MNKDIAIIGMAGRFPDARNLEELFDNLKNGADSVRDISHSRIKNTTLPPEKDYITCGYLEDIDVFDYELFNIPLGEAQTMDPHQRLLLETVYQTFENAGYNIDHVKRSNTAVFVADAELEYYRHADEFVPTLSTGNTKAFLASRISRQFDLCGGVMTVDTSCSSSLVALHLACTELIVGDADYALVCAANLNLFPYKSTMVGLGLESPDGKSRAFSAQAGGMSVGEAVACVLLKPLDKAVHNQNIIHAVIKSSAINCNAGRAASLTAPDSFSQAEVIKKAWRKAGVAPQSIGFIEAHGSGTELGDNIEVGGLDLAFKSVTPDLKICPISTIKSNIGHTRSAAGLVGLLKVVLSLRHKVLFPTIHFDAPNPLINFDKSSVYVNTEYTPWQSYNDTPRYAGISSVGLSGTNCHVVMQEAPASDTGSCMPETSGPYLVTVSSKSATGLKNNLDALVGYLHKHPDLSFRDVAYTLAHGRKHYGHRFACLASDAAALETQLASFPTSISGNTGIDKLIYIFSDGSEVPGTLLAECRAYNVFDTAYSECLLLAPALTAHVASFAFQLAFYRLLAAFGVTTHHVLSIGIGKLVVGVISGELTLKEGVRAAGQYRAEQINDIAARVQALIGRESAHGHVAFLELNPMPYLQPLLAEEAALKQQTGITTFGFQPGKTWAAFLKDLYLAGLDLSFSLLQGQRVELAGYQLAQTRCWIRESVRSALHDPSLLFSRSETLPVITGASEAATYIAELWAAELNVRQLSPDLNFFDLGGDSIKCTRIINKINRYFNIRLDFEDAFDYPTLRALSEFVEQQWTTEAKLTSYWQAVLKVESLAPGDNFFDLGGHSLLANQVLARVRKNLGVDLNFEEFFQNPTIRALASLIDAAVRRNGRNHDYIDLVKIEPQEYYEASHGQKRIWLTSQVTEGSIAYNEQGVYLLTGPLDMSCLQRAFRSLMMRHESLRTTFRSEGVLMQKINNFDDLGFTVEYHDLRGTVTQETLVRKMIDQDAARPFNLEKGPLIRAKVIQRADAQYVCILNLHHIITDGWSARVLIDDLLHYYNGYRQGDSVTLPELPVQYKDYTAWQNNLLSGQHLEAHRRFWLDELGGDLPVINLPADYPRPALKTYNGHYATFTLDQQTRDGLLTLSRETGTTLFMVLLASVKALLYTSTRQTDMIVGSPVAGRDHLNLENQVGFYVNMLALRTRFSHNDSFISLLTRVKESTLKAFDHKLYPFDRIVEDLSLKRDFSRSPLFDIAVVLQNTASKSGSYSSAPVMDGITISEYDATATISKYDLALKFTETVGGMSVGVEYNTDLFTFLTIRQLISAYQQVVAAVLTDRYVALNELSAGSAENATYLKHFLEEKAYWRGVARLGEDTSMKRTATTHETIIAKRDVVTLALTEQETALLTTDVNTIFNTKIEEILLAALSICIRNCFGEEKAFIAVQRDIRSQNEIAGTGEQLDQFYPVVLDNSHYIDAKKHINEVKEYLRKVPGQGEGYGVLKHLLQGSVDERRIFQFRPQLSFAYGSELTVSSWLSAAAATFDFAVGAFQKDRCLTISLSYDADLLPMENMQRFLDSFRNELVRLISLCAEQDERVFSPSDFTYKGLSIEELEDLLN